MCFNSKLFSIKIIVSVLSFFLMGCINSNSKTKTVEKKTIMFSFPYNLSAPNKTYQLPPILEEISALTINDKDELACVQDEDGLIFFFSPTSGLITKKYVFAKAGDYEGIEIVRSIIYVLESNGTIHEIENIGTPTEKITVYDTNLNEGNDTEGLGFDASMNCLLIACKEKAGEGAFYNGQKAVYAFDLETKQLQPEPIVLFTKQDLYEFIETHDLKDLTFDFDKKIPFKPSGIAEFNGLYYTIASSGKTLIVTDKSGNIQYAEKLNSKLLPKPEGITFDSKGNLLISSEGKNGNGRILVFERQN